MEALAAVAIGVVVACGIYLMMSRFLLRIILGTVLLGYGANLLLFLSGGVKRGGPPVLGAAPGGPVTDPLPQALILTAIVIGLATLAFLLVLAYRTYQENRSDDLDALRGLEDE